MAPTEVIRSRRIDNSNVSGESQPHLRWQVLVIFTIFVTMIRFYVLGNKSEILIYCVCGLILLMAALLLSLCSLRKGINTSTSPNRFNDQHQRNGSGNSSIGSRRRSRSNNHNQQQHHQQQQYQLETIINPGDEFNENSSYINDTIIRGRFITNEFFGYGVSMNINNNNLEYSNSDSLEQLHHQNNSLLAAAAAAGAPPPYQIAILLPESSSSTTNKDFDENTPPPSYDKIIHIS